MKEGGITYAPAQRDRENATKICRDSSCLVEPEIFRMTKQGCQLLDAIFGLQKRTPSFPDGITGCSDRTEKGG
jgi:hypothetical protein